MRSLLVSLELLRQSGSLLLRPLATKRISARLLMHLVSSIIALFILVACPLVSFGQGLDKVFLFDQTENSFCTEDVRTRMDTFMFELQRRPGAIGYVIANADRSLPGRFQKYFRTFQTHVVFRRFDPDRIKLFRAPDGGSMRFDYWISVDGISKPELPPLYRSAAIVEPTLYDSSLIISITKDGVEFGYGFETPEPCDWGLNLFDFAMVLNSDPNLHAYLIASAEDRSKAALAKRALSLTAQDLARKHGIPTRRISTKYAGIKGHSAMQLWLVPNDSKDPEFRDGTLR